MKKKGERKSILGPLLTLKKGKKPKTQSPVKEKGMQPYVDIKAFETGVVDNYTNDDKCVPCNDGDLLIVCDGSRSGYVGRAIKGYTGSTLAKISAEGVDNSYLYYFIQSMYRLLNTQMKGTGTPHLNVEVLRKAELVIPSILEQKRIVNKIEELFSELDSAVETLKKTKEQLAVYRQSVLKAAFESQKDCRSVPISEITDDIRIGPFGTMLHKEDYILNGIPVINPQHIKSGRICPSPKVSISKEKMKELSSYQLRKNDIVMGRRGEMGRCAAVTDVENGWLCGTGSILFRLKPDFDAEFYSKILSSPNVVHYLEENATGTTMKNLNEEIVRRIPVPYMTNKMQQKVHSRIEASLSNCENIEKTVNDALIQTDAMRQSILKKAFEGEL